MTFIMVEKMKAGPGRPKGSGTETTVLQIRLSPELKTQIAWAAAMEKTTVSTWLRQVALRELGRGHAGRRTRRCPGDQEAR